jgi:DNA mismatch repair protein MutS
MKKIENTITIFHNIKRKYQDAVLLIRVKDNYISYGEDADILAQFTDHKVATHATEGRQFCIPFHAMDSALPKLVKAGYRVAICDPLQMPVKRKQLRY